MEGKGRNAHEHLQMPGKRAVKQHSPEVLPVCLRVLVIILHFSYILYLKCNMSGRRTLTSGLKQQLKETIILS